MSERYRPSLRDAFENWSESDAPLFRKIGLTARNEWKKIRTGRNCCGNIDEPGC
ncbi:MAG: hypothetical protein WDA27_06355 [Actinomycetota bacterium]